MFDILLDENIKRKIFFWLRISRLFIIALWGILFFIIRNKFYAYDASIIISYLSGGFILLLGSTFYINFAISFVDDNNNGRAISIFLLIIFSACVSITMIVNSYLDAIIYEPYVGKVYIEKINQSYKGYSWMAKTNYSNTQYKISENDIKMEEGNYYVVKIFPHIKRMYALYVVKR